MASLQELSPSYEAAIRRHESNLQQIRSERNGEEQRLEKLKKRIEVKESRSCESIEAR